jgi:retinol dehydrogenase 14
MEQIRDRPMAGKTVLITGATSGIGRATALGLAAMVHTSRSSVGTASRRRRGSMDQDSRRGSGGCVRHGPVLTIGGATAGRGGD